MSDAAAPSPLATVRDFPDRLPAMLVKELRQGLRARLFVESVAGFHLLIMVILLPAVMGLGSPGESEGIQRLVWLIFTAVLVLLLPLRGLSALTVERQSRTLDTLILTNLRAGRIVGGKWLAISAQILMVALSVVPYLLVLYSGGGVSLPGSLLVLGHLVLAGLVLTAAFMALSWNGSWLHRVAPALVLSWLALTQWAWPAVAGLFQSSHVAASTGGVILPLVERISLTALLPAAAGLIFVLLSTTAQRLAPGTESHQAWNRLAALALLAAAALTANGVIGQAALVALVLVSLTALSESWPLQLPPQRSWTHWPGLAPGWPHGVFWALVAWTPAVMMGQLDQPALPLAAWLACGFLLIRPGPASWQNRPWLLAATALIFLAGQLVLLLGAELLNRPALKAWAGLVPSPVFSAAAPPHPVLPWLTGAAALGCLICALSALHRERAHRKGGAE